MNGLTPEERIECALVGFEATSEELARAARDAAEAFRQLAWILEWSDITPENRHEETKW